MEEKEVRLFSNLQDENDDDDEVVHAKANEAGEQKQHQTTDWFQRTCFEISCSGGEERERNKKKKNDDFVFIVVVFFFGSESCGC